MAQNCYLFTTLREMGGDFAFFNIKFAKTKKT